MPACLPAIVNITVYEADTTGPLQPATLKKEEKRTNPSVPPT